MPSMGAGGGEEPRGGGDFGAGGTPPALSTPPLTLPLSYPASGMQLLPSIAWTSPTCDGTPSTSEPAPAAAIAADGIPCCR